MALAISNQFNKFVEFALDGNPTRGMVNRNLCNIRKGLVDGNPRSLDFHIPFMNGEIDRLANLDFAAYDDAPVQQRIDDPNVERPYRDVGPSLGNGFAFSHDVGIEAEFKLTV